MHKALPRQQFPSSNHLDFHWGQGTSFFLYFVCGLGQSSDRQAKTTTTSTTTTTISTLTG